MSKRPAKKSDLDIAAEKITGDPEEIAKALKKWQKDAKIRETEKLLAELFTTSQGSTNHAPIIGNFNVEYTKISVLNTVYSTHLSGEDIYRYADLLTNHEYFEEDYLRKRYHYACNIEKLISDGSSDAVMYITVALKERYKGDTESTKYMPRYHFSFATKYCSFAHLYHNVIEQDNASDENQYPIYDSLVAAAYRAKWRPDYNEPHIELNENVFNIWSSKNATDWLDYAANPNEVVRISHNKYERYRRAVQCLKREFFDKKYREYRTSTCYSKDLDDEYGNRSVDSGRDKFSIKALDQYLWSAMKLHKEEISKTINKTETSEKQK